MKYEMKLQNGPFEKIKDGTKIYELRLKDEKRSKIKKDDFIEFTNRLTNEKLLVKVLNVFNYNNFKDLYEAYDKTLLGYKENEKADYKDMEQYYSKEEQNKYGVVAIQISKVNKSWENNE